MARTDYGSIAARYDESRVRHEIAPEAALGEILEARARPCSVLDVGCGTGNWLAKQAQHFQGLEASWFGIDASPEMLAVARKKLPFAELATGVAESLDFPDAHFDFVATTFAFHHFVDKPKALDEMLREVAPGGRLLHRNICPEHMPNTGSTASFPRRRSRIGRASGAPSACSRSSKRAEQRRAS